MSSPLDPLSTQPSDNLSGLDLTFNTDSYSSGRNTVLVTKTNMNNPQNAAIPIGTLFQQQAIAITSELNKIIVRAPLGCKNYSFWAENIDMGLALI